MEPTSPSVPVAELLILPPTDVNGEEQHLPSADGDTPPAHLSDDEVKDVHEPPTLQLDIEPMRYEGVPVGQLVEEL